MKSRTTYVEVKQRKEIQQEVTKKIKEEMEWNRKNLTKEKLSQNKNKVK